MDTLETLKASPHADPKRIAHLGLTSKDGRWLHANPALYNKVDPGLFKVSLQRWLRSSIFDEEGTCSLCDGVIDRFGDHCLVCPGGGDRTKRHNLIRNAVFHFCCGAGLAPELERPGLLRPRPLQGALPEDGIRRSDPAARRPADVYLPRWRQGVPIALDFAVTSRLSSANFPSSQVDSTAAVRNYEGWKCNYLQTRATCIEEGLSFTPMVVEAVGGGWGECAMKVFYELAKTKSLITGERKNQTLTHLLQNLGIILHRENARAILRRCAAFTHTSPSILAAAATLQSSAAEGAILP